MRVSIIAMVVFHALVGTAWSQQSGSSASINNILISEFTGRVEITQSGDGTTSFELSSAPTPQPQSAEFVDGALIVVGEAHPKDFDIDNALNWRLHKQHAFSKYLDDFGSLKIAATENCNIRFLNSYAEISVTAANATVAIDDGWIEGAIGNVQNADIDIKTHGKIKIGNVEDRLRVKAGGASTIDAGSAGSAELMIGGSGKVSTLNIAGNAITRVNGSGDIRLGSIAGFLDASIAGSGDIQTGPVLGGATYSIAGSGDIESQNVIGETSAHIAGNGDLTIRDGRAENLRVSILGAGDFEFGGTATNINAIVEGPGSLAVAHSEGEMVITGHGDVSIGDSETSE